MTHRSSLVITPIIGVPLINPGDDLARIVWEALAVNGVELIDDVILVLAQKIISKAEGRLVNLNTIVPSATAKRLSEETGKDARYVELVLGESAEILRKRPGLIIAQHRNGFVCANAGIDHSNVNVEGSGNEDWFLLLPENADASACAFQRCMARYSKKRLGVLITDSHGRAWRNGTVGVSIGTCDVPELVNRIGDHDMLGYELKATIIAAADQLAAAATLVMGEAEEGIPVVHVRGFPYPLRQSSIDEVIREKEKDLFR
jgi:coenzyme F420-0:L-glutamate ligase/coenzyme F420-1:gamma-L-glutamate ligase